MKAAFFASLKAERGVQTVICLGTREAEDVTGDSKKRGVRPWYDSKLVSRGLCKGLEVRDGDRVIVMVVAR